MRRLFEQDTAVRAVPLMAPEWLVFSTNWTGESGRVCAAQRSNMDLEIDLVVKYVDLVSSLHARAVFVVTHDPTLDEQFGFAVDAVTDEVTAALERVYGLPLVMFTEEPTAPVILLTDADYLLVAGRPEELRLLLGDMGTVRDDFAEDSLDPDPVRAAILKRALATMDWIEA